jgi:hypothetical protein
MVAESLRQFDHPAWRALAGTIVGYAIVLTIILLVLFVVPYLVYGAL